MVAALVESGYLEHGENGYKIHDWYDYAGKLADQREADKVRKEKAKKQKMEAESQKNSCGNPAEFQRNASGIPTATVPYSTVQYHNTRDMCVNARAREEESDDGFEEFWNAYPRKIGGSIQQAYMEYVHVTDDLGIAPSVLIDAAREQGKDLTTETARYFPGAEKWLRNRGWEQKKPKAKDGETNNIFLEIYQEEHNG